jgi:hypothetical protein
MKKSMHCSLLSETKGKNRFMFWCWVHCYVVIVFQIDVCAFVLVVSFLKEKFGKFIILSLIYILDPCYFIRLIQNFNRIFFLGLSEPPFLHFVSIITKQS